MTIDYLKRGRSDDDRRQDDAQTRASVESTLADIEARGDARCPKSSTATAPRISGCRRQRSRR